MAEDGPISCACAAAGLDRAERLQVAMRPVGTSASRTIHHWRQVKTRPDRSAPSTSRHSASTGVYRHPAPFAPYTSCNAPVSRSYKQNIGGAGGGGGKAKGLFGAGEEGIKVRSCVCVCVCV